MTRRFASLLRRIVGRIREYMGAAYLAMGMFLMTTAVYLKIETAQSGMGNFLAVLGAVNLAVAVYFTRREEQQTQKRDTATLNVLIGIAEKLGVDMGRLEQTLKKFGYEKVGHASNNSKPADDHKV